jgi:hypothetical protein
MSRNNKVDNASYEESKAELKNLDALVNVRRKNLTNLFSVERNKATTDEQQIPMSELIRR